MTELQKMVSGKLYDSTDAELRHISAIAHGLCLKYNNTFEEEIQKRQEIIDELIPNKGTGVYLQGPIYFDYEYAKPITIGSNCWLGGNVTVIGGVSIGEGCVIGAGSVVIKDIPENCFAAGNPCRVIRPITDADRIELKPELF